MKSNLVNSVSLVWMLLISALVACGTDMSGLADVPDSGAVVEDVGQVDDTGVIRGRQPVEVGQRIDVGSGGTSGFGGVGGEGGVGGAGGVVGSGGALACMPVTETCNGQDDDCDGKTDDEIVCPDFTRWRGHNYVFGQEPVTRVAAEIWCRVLGYDLVVIDDANEATWVDGQSASRSASGRWLGISDGVNEGAWLRPDGAPAAFFAWAMGQPNNNAPGVGEDCAALIPTSPGNPTPAWNDMRCDSGTDPSGYALALCESR